MQEAEIKIKSINTFIQTTFFNKIIHKVDTIPATKNFNISVLSLINESEGRYFFSDL